MVEIIQRLLEENLLVCKGADGSGLSDEGGGLGADAFPEQGKGPGNFLSIALLQVHQVLPAVELHGIHLATTVVIRICMAGQMPIPG